VFIMSHQYALLCGFWGEYSFVQKRNARSK
jgi:hypothetical protein